MRRRLAQHHPLRRWMDAWNYSFDDVARRVSDEAAKSSDEELRRVTCTRGHVSNIAGGSRRPGACLAVLLSRATGGAVTVEQFITYRPPREDAESRAA